MRAATSCETSLLHCCPAIPPVDKVLFDKGDSIVARLDTNVTARCEPNESGRKNGILCTDWLHRLVVVVELFVIQSVLQFKFQ